VNKAAWFSRGKKSLKGTDVGGIIPNSYGPFNVAFFFGIAPPVIPAKTSFTEKFFKVFP